MNTKLQELNLLLMNAAENLGLAPPNYDEHNNLIFFEGQGISLCFNYEIPEDSFLEIGKFAFFSSQDAAYFLITEALHTKLSSFIERG